jgi:hypothetical protein
MPEQEFQQLRSLAREEEASWASWPYGNESNTSARVWTFGSRSIVK